MMNPAEFENIAKAEQDFWWYRGMRRIFYRIADPIVRRRAIRRALEAGCGTGYFARELERRYGWQVFPVDLGARGLEHARRMGVERAVQADIATLPFPGDAFDAVISMDVIVHFPTGEEERAAAELARVLRPQGLLAVRVSALEALRSRHSAFAGERQRFTRARLSRLFEQRGIRILRCTYANSLLMPVALAKFRIWEPLLRRPPASGVAAVPGWLDRLLFAPLAVEASWLGAGLNLPAGQSLVLIGEKAG